MKAPWMVSLVAVMAMGVLAGSAGAAIQVSLHLELAPGETGVLTPADGNVLINVYAYMASTNATYGDDGINRLDGSFISTGSLHGNLQVVSVPSAFQASPTYTPGTVQDLNGDGSLDIGGKDPNLQNVTTPPASGNYFSAFAGLGQFALVNDANRILVGQLLYTATESVPTGSSELDWVYRTKTSGTGTTMQQYKIDGVTTNVAGGSANLQTVGVVITTPEPATMAILGLGAMVNLFLRRRRSA